MAEWYRDHLGIPIEDSVALFAWRGGKDGKAHGHTVWSIFPADTKYFGEDSAPFMINYRVKDLDRLREALRAEGVDVDRDVEESKYGRFGWVRDPEGNRIELWEPPETESRARKGHADGIGLAAIRIHGTLRPRGLHQGPREPEITAASR